MVHGGTEAYLASKEGQRLRNKVQLIFTSPPFPLNRKKRYGNQQGEAYIEWLAGFAKPFKELLTPTGSIVLEMGNAWEPGQPVMSTLALRALLEFLKRGEPGLEVVGDRRDIRQAVIAEMRARWR